MKENECIASDKFEVAGHEWVSQWQPSSRSTTTVQGCFAATSWGQSGAAGH
jgi:hypothetical protein